MVYRKEYVFTQTSAIAAVLKQAVKNVFRYTCRAICFERYTFGLVLKSFSVRVEFSPEWTGAIGQTPSKWHILRLYSAILYATRDPTTVFESPKHGKHADIKFSTKERILYIADIGSAVLSGICIEFGANFRNMGKTAAEVTLHSKNTVYPHISYISR